jgi:hypothetical protein
MKDCGGCSKFDGLTCSTEEMPCTRVETGFAPTGVQTSNGAKPRQMSIRSAHDIEVEAIIERNVQLAARKLERDRTKPTRVDWDHPNPYFEQRSDDLWGAKVTIHVYSDYSARIVGGKYDGDLVEWDDSHDLHPGHDYRTDVVTGIDDTKLQVADWTRPRDLGEVTRA